MKISSFLILAMMIILVTGCSGKSSPMIPESSNTRNNPGALADYSPIIVSSADGVTTYQGVYGAWRIVIDPANLAAEIIPARNSSAIGDFYDADLSQFLEVSPCANCVEIGGLRIDGYENLLFEIRLKHPFSNAAARPDLHGFDVRGIFIVKDSDASTIDFPDIDIVKPGGTIEPAKISSIFVLNADGYTSHFDELASDTRYFTGAQDVPGNLNPFLRFYEDYSVPDFDPANPSGHNVMKTGASFSSRTAVLNAELLENTTEVYFIADVSYGQSAVLANRQNPKYFLPAFHRTEPWRVEYWIENNGLDFTNASSTADLIFQVFDWQQNATVDPNYPDQTNLSGIPESSRVNRLEFSIPSIQNDILSTSTPLSGNGTPSDPLKYKITITNQNQCDHETYGLLAIRDELYEAVAPHGRIPIPVSPAGFPYETQDIRDYAYYQIIPVYITKQPLASGYSYYNKNEMRIPSKDLYAVQSGGIPKLVLHPEFFMDNSHRRFQYRWDYDYDGVTFDIDGSGLPSPEIEFASGGKKTLGLRIRTNTVPATEYLYSINVYGEGEGFHKFTTSVASTDSTNLMMSHTGKATEDRFYFLTTRATASYMKQNLNIMDRNGNLTAFTPISSSGTDPEYNGVLEVIDSGVNAGVYIAYTRKEGADDFVYFTKCDLDGANFLTPHKRVSTLVAGHELQPIILQQYGKLHVYYCNVGPGTSQIFGSHSSDYGATWTPDGAIANNGSTTQLLPSASKGSGIWLVWTDLKDMGTYGPDLWIGSSGGGDIFSDLWRISQTDGVDYEWFPSTTWFQSQLAIAYLFTAEGSSESHPRIMFYNTTSKVVWDYPIRQNKTTSQYINNLVSIGSATNGRYVCAYSAENSSGELFAEVVELTLGPGIGMFNEELKYESGPMSVDSNGRSISPVVICYKPIGHDVVENFVAWRDFTSGFYQSVAPYPVNCFGQVDTMYFVSPADSNM